VEPVLRIAAWLLITGLERAALEIAALPAGRAARERRREGWRRRAAERAVAALGALRGIWVKAGQFAAHRHDVLPVEASQALADLRDRVPPLPADEIRAAVERELGGPLERRFRRFEPRPIGAASVAQVHRAELPDGSPVAVKVQYPGLESCLPADLALARAGLRALGWLTRRRGVDPARLVAEFEAGLRDELDFRREARIAQEIAANLAGDAAIVVPGIVASHSTRRVLTMEYRPAVPITDRLALARLGVAPAEVVSIVARAYARQVFGDGLFHADPHPGNLLVLDEPEAAKRPRVLFIDFGLSRRLEPELRRAMRRGVYALIQRDADAFVGQMDALGMIAPNARPGVQPAVERMFARIGQQGGALAVPGSAVLSLKDEAKTLLRDTPGLQLPHDLVLFARTLSSVFALGEELDPEVDLMQVTLPHLLRFLAEKD
jgi:predicted unusual protein kinase regulating ubiquinone biosynthesis (AarF/ABC1/UbiB family)